MIWKRLRSEATPRAVLDTLAAKKASFSKLVNFRYIKNINEYWLKQEIDKPPVYFYAFHPDFHSYPVLTGYEWLCLINIYLILNEVNTNNTELISYSINQDPTYLFKNFLKPPPTTLPLGVVHSSLAISYSFAFFYPLFCSLCPRQKLGVPSHCDEARTETKLLFFRDIWRNII